MLPMNVFAQIMNSFSEQSFFDHQISQEQYLLCKNEAGVIEVRHVEELGQFMIDRMTACLSQSQAVFLWRNRK